MLPTIISLNSIDITHLVSVINGEPDETRKSAMLSFFNNMLGTNYGLLGGRVTMFKIPNDYSNTHDLYAWIANWDYKKMPTWETVEKLIAEAEN